MVESYFIPVRACKGENW